MKWLLILAFGMLGCGDDPVPTLGGGTVPPGNIPGTGGSAGGGGGGLGGAGGFEPRGACDNVSDLDAIESATDSIRNIARNCGVLVCAGPAYESCVSTCVADRVSALSEECAACYGSLEQCSQSASCGVRCQFDTCRAACLECLNDAGCITDFEACRGLPGDGCPG